MGKFFWYLSAALLIVAAVAGIGIYFGYVKEAGPEQGRLIQTWVHPIHTMTKNHVYLNQTCFNMFRPNADWDSNMMEELCGIEEDDQKLVPRRAASTFRRFQSSLFWIEDRYLAAFYGDYQLYATNDEELSERTKAKIAAMIDADENCYLYESNGGMKEFEFFTTDCGLFLPTFCAKGPQSGTCTQSLTYDTK